MRVIKTIEYRGAVICILKTERASYSYRLQGSIGENHAIDCTEDSYPNKFWAIAEAQERWDREIGR